MRLLRSIRRLRNTASAASPPAATSNAPPTASATLRAGPEFSGGDATVFVDATGPGGGTETIFGGGGAELVGATGLAGGAGAALV